jgi:LacI family transcriptional regulator
MRTTIKDLARDLGVNAATVSRALNDKPGVSEALRRQILRRAAECHYTPHGNARGLVTQRTETLGLLFNADTCTFLANPFYGAVLAGIEKRMRERGLALMFASMADQEPEGPEQLPKFIRERRIDGLLVVGSVEASLLRVLKEMDIVFLLVDYHLGREHFDAVLVDNHRGGYMAAAHLIDYGHRNIGFVGGAPLDHGNFYERKQGYLEAMEHAGMSVPRHWIVSGDEEGGYESTLCLLKRDPDITGIVACNDANALASVRAVQASGRNVPADISVVGFDDIPAACQAWPPLTTVAVEKEAIGRVAVERVLDLISADGNSVPHETVFPAELVIRESTGPVRPPGSGPQY